MFPQKLKQALVVLAVFLLIVFNYPFLSAANKPGGAYPALYLFIFIGWVIAIAIVYFMLHAKHHKDHE